MEKGYTVRVEGDTLIITIQIEDVKRACLAGTDHKRMLTAFSMNMGTIKQVAGEEGCIGVSYSVTPTSGNFGATWTLKNQSGNHWEWSILEANRFGPVKKYQSITIVDEQTEGKMPALVIENRIVDGPELLFQEKERQAELQSLFQMRQEMNEKKEKMMEEHTKAKPKSTGFFGGMVACMSTMMGTATMSAQPSTVKPTTVEQVKDQDKPEQQAKSIDPMLKSMILLAQEYFCNYEPLVIIPTAEIIHDKNQL